MRMLLASILIILVLQSCKRDEATKPTTYQSDVEFLNCYDTTLVELYDEKGNSKVVVSGAFQGRVMTSTSSGNSGTSYGWINYNLIASGEKKNQFNPVGGEERFWLGPEGGQYSLYFHKGDSFLIKNWQVPPVIDTESFEVSETSATSVTFKKETSLTNYSGTRFDIRIERSISLLNQSELQTILGSTWSTDIKYVAYRTNNQVTNVGANNWNQQEGLLSIWLLGMFTPSEKTTVIIPFKPIANAGEHITTNYFGDIPSERISIEDSILFFTCDGKLRSKIGLSPAIAKPVSASFDFEKNILTITKFEIAPQAPYVNSKWELQTEPYRGDAVNSYNDGPLADGSQLGPFYELESSSPALALNAGETGTFQQLTVHFEGDFEKLNQLSLSILGVDLNKIKK